VPQEKLLKIQTRNPPTVMELSTIFTSAGSVNGTDVKVVDSKR